MQLVGEENGARIDMLDTMKSARIYIPEVEEKFGVTHDLVGDVAATLGMDRAFYKIAMRPGNR